MATNTNNLLGDSNTLAANVQKVGTLLQATWWLGRQSANGINRATERQVVADAVADLLNLTNQNAHSVVNLFIDDGKSVPTNPRSDLAANVLKVGELLQGTHWLGRQSAHNIARKTERQVVVNVIVELLNLTNQNAHGVVDQFIN